MFVFSILVRGQLNVGLFLVVTHFAPNLSTLTQMGTVIHIFWLMRSNQVFSVVRSQFLQVFMQGDDYKQLTSCLFSISDFKSSSSLAPQARATNTKASVNTNSNRVRDIFMTF